MFTNDRSKLRQAYAEAWRKKQTGEPMQPLEEQIATVIGMHPEYHAMLENPASIEKDFHIDAGQANPFLHMGMHIALHEQLSIDRPGGIAALYHSAVLKSGDAHATEHRFMDCLGEALWNAQRSGTAPDEPAYLDCLRKIG